MSNSEQTFVAVDDSHLAAAIGRAKRRLVFAAPGLGKLAGRALVDAIVRLAGAVTIILDADADACRIGYGDPEALQALHEAASRQQFPLRRQAGLRIGVLISDDSVLIWSPIARSVEAERHREQPNGVALSGPATDICSTAMAGDETSTLPENAEIGRTSLTLSDLKDTVDDLQRNPPAPFDLARRTRVFSTRFQFVEFEVRGAQLTERKINLSSVLLNADLPEPLRELLDTQIRPYQREESPSFAVTHLVTGIRVFDRTGKQILVQAKQSQILKYWAEIRDHYLTQLPGFGWLIKRDQLGAFREAAVAFEETLRSWVEEFKKYVAGREDSLVKDLVSAIKERVSHSDQSRNLKELDLDAEVRKGLARLRAIEPHVRVIVKDVAWESTRDAEFQEVLEQALSPQDREGWFEEFTAVRQRTSKLDAR